MGGLFGKKPSAPAPAKPPRVQREATAEGTAAGSTQRQKARGSSAQANIMTKSLGAGAGQKLGGGM